jgi:hypothetical protein
MKTFKQIMQESKTNLRNDDRITDQGFYSAVHLDQESYQTLSQFCKRNFPFDLPDDVHCTVMYSTKSIDPTDSTKYSKPVYQAYADHFEFWDGHDKSGYLVLKLVSTDLQNEHQRLKKLGCNPTFENYSPHITIKTPIEKSMAKPLVDIGNNDLDDLGIKLSFTNQTIDTLKL